MAGGASRHPVSYGWRLFLPLVGALWLVIVASAAYQYRTEADLRRERVDSELRLLNSRIIAAYEDGQELAPVIGFAARYYENSALNGLRISVYDSRGRLLHCVGDPIPASVDGRVPPELVAASATGHATSLRRSEVDPARAYYYFGVRSSADGAIYVHTAMPYTSGLLRELAVGKGLWLLFMALAAGATLFAYVTTRMLGRSLRMLHDFATRAAAGLPLPPGDAFPRNELGDITRQIHKLYTDKDAALGESAREHALAQQAAEEKISVTRELTNNINHELKTPVGVIRGYLDTIAAHPEMDAEVRRRFVESARDAIERLCVLLNDVSSLARLEQGAAAIAIGEVDMDGLLARLSAELVEARLAANVAFVNGVAPGCRVVGNYDLLYGALMNLVRNAELHSHGTRCELRLIDASPQEYTFAFGDDGVGVAEEHLPRLFDRFYRVDRGRSRRVGGAGLGLPIVKDTITLLGGTVLVRNRQGGGLEVVFTLRRP